MNCALSMVPDEVLVQSFRQGEEDAFSQLYSRYRQRVLTTAYRIVRNPEDAQDATQEIFMKLYRYLPTWDLNKATLSTWLYRLASNHAIDCWRFRNRRSNAEILHCDPEVQACEGIVTHTPHVYFEEKEAMQEIRRCVNMLPRLQKRLFILRYFHGLSLEEIARIEQRSLGTVKGLLYRAKNTLRTRLQKERGRPNGAATAGQR